MSTDYNYDEKGQFFPYFILTICGLVTLPLTYSSLKPSKELENTAPRIHTDFRPPDGDVVDAQRRRQWRRERKLKRMVTAFLGWLVIGWMLYLIISTARTLPKIWDPYDVLGISRSLNEKAIRSHYKRLSLKFHPDKIRPDPAKNQTIESLNDHFVDLTKAYKALTDEEVRNNYIQYGHPDGKQSMSIGIALPKFMITEGNGKYVLLVYGLLLGVLLPYVVGRWWYGTQRVTKEKVLVASAGKLFREYDEAMSEAEAVSALSVGDEFGEVLRSEQAEEGIATIEKRILAEQSGAGPLLTDKDRALLAGLDGGVRRKVLGLLWAYLGRVDPGDATLKSEKYEVAPIAFALNESLLAICLAYGNVGSILASYYTSQNLIQAVPPLGSPLLQLPHMTPKVSRAIEGPNAKHRFSVQRFMRIPENERRRLTIGPGLMTESQYQVAVGMARQIPILKVERAFFKVVGERFVTPSSLVQFVVKARVVPPGTTSIPDLSEADLEDVDPEEGDVEALLGRKPSRNKGVKMAAPTSGAAPDEDNAEQPPLAFAPYFARDHSPRWHIFLSDSKQGKMAVPPFTFTSFDKPMFTDEGKPTLAVQTLKMQFQAPPQAGQFTFVMHLVCDSYIGTDTKMEVTMDIEGMGRAEAMVGEDEISEPDEDSLAGQMASLRRGSLSGGTSNKRKSKGKSRSGATVRGAGTTNQEKKPRVEEVGDDDGKGGQDDDDDDEEDDDESDTDGDEDDTSDTDTDTDSDGD